MFVNLQIFLYTVFGLGAALKLPSYLEPCRISDPELNDCMKDHGNAALPSIVKGDKQYKLRTFTPFRSPEMNLDIGDSLKFTIRNASMTGFETSRIEKSAKIQNRIRSAISSRRFDKNAKRVELVMHFDYIHLEGDYEMRGELLVIPIFGSGLINVTLTEPVCNYKTEFDVISKGDEKYYSLVKADANLETKKVVFYFSNLFNGNERLGNNMNHFINDNWADVYEELKYSINNIIRAIVNDVIEAYIDQIPVKEFFKH